MQKKVRYPKILLLSFVLFFSLLLSIFTGFFTGFSAGSSSGPSTVHAASSTVKIKYNGKTHKNKSKKLSVKYNTKTVSKSSYKALVINGSYMVPYTDVFKSGVKATCSYSKKTKTIKIKKNGVTIKMQVGSKTAYVDSKKVKLPAAPLSVRYVSKKTTKIMVPVAYVAKALHLTYAKDSTGINLGDSLHLSYDGEETYYTGVQGSIYYNHSNYNLSTMPVIKIDGSMYCPAEEVVSDILKLNYTYNATNNTITINNQDLQLELVGQIDSDVVTLNGNEYTLSAPIKIITNLDTQKEVVCIPAASVLKQLDYTRSWDKTNKYYNIQSKAFFSWKKELNSTQTYDTSTNYVNSIISDYTETNGIGSVNFNVTGSVTEIMNTLTVKRSNSVITVTIPNSDSILDKNSFENFGEIINKMEITKNEDNSLCITLNCVETADFSYVVQDNTLSLNVLFTYPQSTTTSGKVTKYSLSIPKPDGVTFDDVTNQDLYASKKFKIIISGNYVKYYQEHPVVIGNNSVKSVSVSKVNNTTQITVATSSLRGYKIYDNGDSFGVSIGAPKDIYKSIVVLDAGHGGHDPGAQNKGTNEKDLTFKIIYTLMKKYTSSNAPDVKIYWTRTTDTFITLAKRAAFAKSVSADVFISLHMNSASNSSANGTEVYYSVNNNNKSFSGITSKKMASMFKTKLVTDLGTKSRGTKTAGYYVIKHNTVPAILIELGFISGSSDYKKLTNTAFQEKAAKAIYDQIVSMFNTYPTGRTGK
jgi:N-acetylmuramoyl-L-alanine amidase